MLESRTVSFTDQLGVERRMVVRLDEDAHIPRFEQLRGQISVMVAVGRLEPGVRLPTVRSLAYQLRMAPGTVARAYRELESEGIVVGRGRAGTFVADEPPHSEPLEERRNRIRAAAEWFVGEMRQLDQDLDAALAAVERAFVDGENS